MSFSAQVLIIATGGAVRLTSSGLGCPTWPLCTSDSLVNTPEMGIHGFIEFGNRTLTGVVGGLAVVVLLLVVRLRKQRTDLCALAAAVFLGVVVQALVGGITVLTGLNPFVVGFHYIASIVLVCVCAAFLVRIQAVPRPTDEAPSPAWFSLCLSVMAVTTAITIVLGVLTTGAGPHSGDPHVGRNGFDAELLQHIHSWPSYFLLFITTVLTVAAQLGGYSTRYWLIGPLSVQGAQVVLGLVQASNGLPPLAVGAHMVLAALVAALSTVVLLTAHPDEAPRGPS
ncbi:MAG: COX15/CtaA family protein [Dietzia sp.]